MKFVYGALALLAALGVYVFSRWRRPWPTESDLSHRLFFYFKYYYSTKYLNHVRHPEKGSGLKEHFHPTTPPVYESELSSCEHFTIGAVGDLMMRRDLEGDNSPHLWDAVAEHLFSTDLTMGNLEFTVNPNKNYYQIIRYSIQEHHAMPVLPETKFGKFDYLALANNHLNDSGHEGICSTQEFVDRLGYLNSGISTTPDKVDDFPIVEVKGVKIALLSYSFTNNGIPFDEEKEFGLNLVRFNALRDEDYDPSIIKRHVKLAKERGADLIVANNHWGIEFEFYPSSRLVRRAHDLMESGVDIIVGHHPHILNPAEWYKAKDGRNCLCLYSLGNITSFALKRPIMNLSEIAKIHLETGLNEAGEREVRLLKTELTPTLFSKKYGRVSDHRILPLFETEKAIDAGTPVAHNGPWDKHVVKMLAKEMREYLVQDGFEYR